MIVTTPLPDTTGEQIKNPVPGVGYLLGVYLEVVSHRLPNIIDYCH